MILIPEGCVLFLGGKFDALPSLASAPLPAHSLEPAYIGAFITPQHFFFCYALCR
jgi:hypothetical protein